VTYPVIAASNNAAIASLRSECDILRGEAESLRHELLMATQRAEATENQVEFLLMSHQTNMAALDTMLATHGMRRGEQA
jgi:hypothetical protein